MSTHSLIHRFRRLCVSQIRLKIIFFQAVFVFLLCYEATAQPLLFPSNHRRYVIKTINIENGLQNNTVGDIITDTFGFTWVATKTGLQRYNGYRLETIQPLVNGHLLNIDYQIYFLQTSDHMIWMCCKEGILQYNPFLGTFTFIISYPSAGTHEGIRPLQDTREGAWYASRKSLILFGHDGRWLQEVPYPEDYYKNIPQRMGKTTNSRYIFFLIDQGQIIRFDKITHSFLPLPEAGPASDIAATENKLYRLYNGGISVYKATDSGLTLLHTFQQANRFSGTVKIFGSGILANIDQHLLYLDSGCEHINEIATLNGGSFLTVGFVKYIYSDQFNRIWIIASNDIRLILNYTVPFQYFAYRDAINFSKSIYADEDENRVLAGFYDGGLQLYDTLTNPLWKRPLRTNKVKDIAGIEKLGKNEYFINTIGQGWYILDLKKQIFTPVSLSAEEAAKLDVTGTNWTNSLQHLDKGLLIANHSNILLCRFRHNRMTSAKILFHDTSNQVIFCSYFNKSDNNLWVGTSNGLVYCKDVNGIIDSILTPGGYQVRCIITDAQNNAWAGTDKGLFVYNASTHKLIRSFTVADGLLNDCIYSMLTDKERRTIYAGTNLGLSSIELNGSIKNYTKERGLQENEFNSAATTISASGKLYFGGVNGVTAFYPNDITTETDHPSLVVYKTTINDEASTGDSAAWNKMQYRLAPSHGAISFSLAAFGTYQASDYTYEYQMVGFDKYWTTTNNPVNISYHLSPGTYHFKARLASFPSQAITRDIVVAAPFWQRWWFYVLVFFLLSSLAWAIARTLYRRRYKEQLQLLQIRQQVVAERERISRDLHDNIGAYASAISANVDEVIEGGTRSNPDILQKLKESAREIIVQLRDSIWALNKETQTVIMLSDRIKNYMQKLQPAYPAIRFDVEEDIAQNATLPSITALHLLRIVQEAIHNAVKHSGCTSIQVAISSHSPVKISVADNGRGMPLSPVYGDGVKNMQLRAADIGWEVEIQSGASGCTVQLTGIPS